MNSKPDSNAAAVAAPKSAEAAPQPQPQPHAAQPHYDSGLRYDSGIRYVAGDPVDTAPNDGGLVKLGTSTMPDPVFLNFCRTENDAMTNNPNYTTPSPSVADVAAAITEFQTRLNTMEGLKLQLKEATNQKNTARADLENLIKVRATYVQLTSNGNTALILNGGFQVRATPTPVGVLPPPADLSVELNGTAGVMFLKWSPVAGSRGYNIQCSPANTMERTWTPLETTTTARYKCDGMTLGQTYAFRIAAIGGSTGQSDWSAEVVRMAA